MFNPTSAPGICLLRLLLISLVSFINNRLQAQVRWDGEGADGQWNTAANWVGNTVPSAGDDVILDNSFVPGSYSVMLPAGLATVTVKSLTLSPANPSYISVELPGTSTAAPAFAANGPGYGLVLNTGAVFINSSGATSGNPVAIADSIKIADGGRYIHRSKRSHTANVMVLSAAPGTEAGIFEFDIPMASSTISVSGRVFGKLVLSTAAAGGTANYTGVGTSNLILRSDLELGAGVTLSLNLADTLFVAGRLVQEGGVLNLANSVRNLVVAIGGNIVQRNAGLITKTGAALPTLLLNGSATQYLEMTGRITNDILVRVANRSGITLLGDLVLPYQLDLQSGIVFTGAHRLVLQEACRLKADSVSGASFVEGSLRKEGLTATDHFLFPVGSGNMLRWLALKNVTGSFTVAFHRTNPRGLANLLGAGLAHISAIEYWSVVPDAQPGTSGAVELSFDNIYSGGVTDLSSLRVGQLAGNTWYNAGNAGSTGITRSGSVIGKPVSFDTTGLPVYFTLASSEAFQNPLPVRLISFSAYHHPQGVMLNWRIDPSWQPQYFQVESGTDGQHFAARRRVPSTPGQSVYACADNEVFQGRIYYRLRWVDKDGISGQSVVISLNNEITAINNRTKLFPVPAKYRITVQVRAATAEAVHVSVRNSLGIPVYSQGQKLLAGENNISIDISQLRDGVYFLSVAGHEMMETLRMIKE